MTRVFKIYRVRKGKKPLTVAQLMHNHVEAENEADALRRYRALNPSANVNDLDAMEAA